MATSTNPTFEEVDKHIQSIDVAAFQAGGKHYLAPGAGHAAALPNVCPAYKAVRPILMLLSNTPLIPATWRAVLKTFIAVMDVLCP